MTSKECAITSSSPEETEKIAEGIGGQLRGGEVIELVSDLGGGKTTFVRGLARGVGSSDHVSSPTFKISNVYAADKLEIQHFDFYRLAEAGLIAHELEAGLHDPGVVVVVEWGDIVKYALPDNRLTVQFSQAGGDSRQLVFSCTDELTYLLRDLC